MSPSSYNSACLYVVCPVCISTIYCSLQNWGFSCRIPKPNFKPEKPEYYGPADFAIGAMIEAYGSRFVIVNADAAVLTYMEKNPSHFPRTRAHF